MFRYFSLAFKNSLRNRRRSISHHFQHRGFALPAGCADRHVSRAFSQEQTPGQALRLVVRHKVSLAQPIPVAYEAKIRQDSRCKRSLGLELVWRHL